MGSVFLPSLPVIETEQETRLRTPEEVGARILCLIAVAAASDGVERKEIIDWLESEPLIRKLSGRESAFLNKSEIDEHERIQFSWQSECAWLLLWASNKVSRDLPVEECDIQEILANIPDFGSSTSSFVESIMLRPKEKIVDLSDFLYRAHWATRQNSTDGSVAIGKLHPGVVQEWHYAINWLTFYSNYEDWDEVTTDT